MYLNSQKYSWLSSWLLWQLVVNPGAGCQTATQGEWYTRRVSPVLISGPTVSPNLSVCKKKMVVVEFLYFICALFYLCKFISVSNLFFFPFWVVAFIWTCTWKSNPWREKVESLWQRVGSLQTWSPFNSVSGRPSDCKEHHLNTIDLD